MRFLLASRWNRLKLCAQCRVTARVSHIRWHIRFPQVLSLPAHRHSYKSCTRVKENHGNRLRCAAQNENEVAEDSIEELKSRPQRAGSAEVEEDEEGRRNFELPALTCQRKNLTVHVVSPSRKTIHLLAALPRCTTRRSSTTWTPTAPRVHRVRVRK